MGSKTQGRSVIRRAISLGLWLLFAGVPFLLAESKFKGEHIDRLETLREVYFNVVVRDVGPRTLVFQTQQGLGSIALKDLPPDLRQHFGYDPTLDAQESQRLVDTTEKLNDFRRREATSRSTSPRLSRFDHLYRLFGKDPILLPEMDLRPRIKDMNLKVKRQGRRPSCAVFSVVSALEYLNAETSGRGESLSEEYLIWATAKVTGRIGTNERQVVLQDQDFGFLLTDVVAALRSYGISSLESMPNSYSGRMAAIAEPPPELVAEARGRLSVRMHPLPHADRRSMLLAFVHILNDGIPFCVGVQWPTEATSRSGVLDRQRAMGNYAHAVAIMGYRCPDGRPESLRFIFKNSWGQGWGMGGYGEMSYDYLSKYLLDALLLEVQ